MDQTTLFDATQLQTEEDLIACALPILRRRVSAHWGDPEWVRAGKKKGFSALYFLNEGNLIARVRAGAKTKRLEIRGSYWKLIPKDVPSSLHYVKIKNKDGLPDEHLDYCYILLDEGWHEGIEKMLEAIIDRIFETLPCDFACCSSYAACSDAMRCLHPGDRFYLDCSYRKKLFSGGSFFGQSATN